MVRMAAARDLHKHMSSKVFFSELGGRQNLGLVCEVQFCSHLAAGAGRAGRGRSDPVS